MPYEPVPDKNQPELDEEITIWRYMDFPKFASLISTQSLYFCQIPLLGDPFEGSYLKTVVDGIERVKPIIAKKHPHLARTDEETRSHILTQRAHTYASCWHMNEYESAAMWDLYAPGGYGIAVKSTFGRLKSAIRDVKRKVWIGVIKYLDYNSDKVNQHTLWTPMLLKRKSFEHERELRALIMDYNMMGKWTYVQNSIPGKSVSIDLSTLIEKVYISPNAPKWFNETVKSTAEAFGWNDVLVIQSNMEAEPRFGPT